MIILAIKTDQPQAYIALYSDDSLLHEISWGAHRQLADTLHVKINELLTSQQKIWKDVEAIVCFKGPGSFTGLRIGLSVANALAYGLNIPIVSNTGKSWLQNGIKRLLAAESETIALPEYGGSIHITTPKK